MACADKAHKVDGDGGAQVCSSTPQAAGTSTLIALRPLPFFYPHIVAKAVTGKLPPSLGLCLVRRARLLQSEVSRPVLRARVFRLRF